MKMRLQDYPTWLLCAVFLFFLYASVVGAQDGAPTFTMTSEQDIGSRCVLASALEPGTDTLWAAQGQLPLARDGARTL